MEQSIPVDRRYSVEEFERIAQSRMSRAAYAYVAGAAGSGSTALANREAFSRWVFRPRALVDVAEIDLKTTVLGNHIDLPILFAPTALHSLAHPDGEIATARATNELGTLMVASTNSSVRLEAVIAETRRAWFQCYWYRDRSLTLDLVQRAEASGYQAICLTVDAPVYAWREQELRLPLPRRPGIEIVNLPRGADDFVDSSLTWASLEWLRSVTELPIVVKGLLTPEDALIAMEVGVDGLIVSNHGGRQLDSAIATLDALPAIAEAVAGRVDVLMDGGIRRGSDVLKALALGARAVLIGRPIYWGLAAEGASGIVRVVNLLRGELASAMGHTGVTSVNAVDQSVLAANPGCGNRHQN